MDESNPQSKSVDGNAVNAFNLVRRIIAVVEGEAGITKPQSLIRQNREIYVSKFRDDAIYLARTMTDLSYPQLGFIFHRHHTAVLSAFRRAELRRTRNPPRRDHRTWIEWHTYLIEKVKALP